MCKTITYSYMFSGVPLAIGDIPLSYNARQIIVDVAHTVPYPCSVVGTAAVGDHGKDVGVAVTASDKNGVSGQTQAPVKLPNEVFSFTVLGFGLKVYGSSWHNVTGVGFSLSPNKVVPITVTTRVDITTGPCK